MRKRMQTFIFIILFGLILFIMMYFTFFRMSIVGDVSYKCKVTDIINSDIDTSMADEGVLYKNITFRGNLVNQSNRKIIAYQNLAFNKGETDIQEVKIGDTVFLSKASDGSYSYVVHDRTPGVFLLTALFCGILLLFGRSKGFKTIITLTYTILAILFVFIPAIITEGNITFWALITAIYVTLMTLFIMNGTSRKSICGIISCLGGIFITFLLSLFSVKFLHLSGTAIEGIQYLYQDLPFINFKNMLMACFVIGAIGAIMDVAVELSASLWELKLKAKDSSVKSLISSGFHIGRDMIGTMSNTLILAYTSTAIVMLINNVYYFTSFSAALSYEMVACDIAQMLIGSIGILLTIPITSITCAFIYNIKDKKKKTKKIKA